MTNPFLWSWPMAGTIANHVWQSTLFALAAIPLAALLRHNRAQVRFYIWITASLKFLIPFSLLVSTGKLLPSPAAAQSVAPVLFGAAKTLTIPEFTYALTPLPTQSWTPSGIAELIWAIGFSFVVLRWLLQWRSVQRIAARAKPLLIALPIPVLSSPTAMEPGVFGVLRPVLLLPDGIADHLSPEQLSAIVAHELCHVRRRDNLTSALHMAVEAVFWFHPLVWWIGSRLVEERERACDEEVLRQGNAPEAYAEGILNVCKFCLESPLPCVAGVTGSPLKKRIETIMTKAMSRKLDTGRKLLLAGAALCVVVLPVAVGVFRIQAQQQKPLTFDVATIKPADPNARNGRLQLEPNGGLKMANLTVKQLIAFARNIRAAQVLGGPAWLETEKFDIEGKNEPSGPLPDMMNLTDAQRKEIRRQLDERVTSLLIDRFKLIMKSEMREMPAYDLVIDKSGSRLQPAEVLEVNKPMVRNGRGSLTATSAEIENLTQSLSQHVDRPVLDKTGLKGRFNWKLEWTPDPPPGTAAPELSGPSLFTAVQEQLGLKLESQKALIPVLIIERAEKPTAN